MNDADFEAQKARVGALLQRWKDRLGLHNYLLKQSYYRGPMPPDEGGDDRWRAAATASVQWEYLRAELSFNLAELAGMADDDVERMIIHELMHVAVAEMRDDTEGIKHEERVCSLLAQAFLWTRQAGSDGADNAPNVEHSAAVELELNHGSESQHRTTC